MTTLNNIIATWFYLGRISKAPGTWGSIGGGIFIYMLFFYWHDIFGQNITPLQYLCFTVALFLIGILAADKFDKDHKTHDSKMIVIDEVVGMMITIAPLVWVFQNSETSLFFSGWQQPIIAFVLFRFFDILKPWPIGAIDRKIKGGLGVMIDDVIAGIFAAIGFIAIGYMYHVAF